MFNRPRCRDWSPLATQQLRLRNLIGITGQSIACSIKSKLYFTLHLTAMSAPFYTSEKIDSHGSGNVDWPEINCPFILKSTARSICIRVWEHIPLSEDIKTSSSSSFESGNEIISSKRHHKDSLSSPSSVISSSSCNSNNSNSSSSNDKMLFIWGVYFSGLVLLTKRSEAKFHPNSLIFQMHGGYFVSAESLTQDSMRLQLKITYQLDQEINIGVVRGDSPPPRLNASKNLNRNYEQFSSYSLRTAAESCDIFSNSSNSNLTNSKLIIRKISIPSVPASAVATTTTNNDSEFQINSPRSSRSCSPVRNTNFSCPPSIDISRDLLGMLKIRYIDKRFLKSEIRPSYNLEKLLQLQDKQRKYKHRSEDAKEIIEKICMKSAFCLNLELFSSHKGLLYRQRSHPSMGRTLNRLLYQQEPQIKPEDLLKAQELKRQIETARFRCRSLQQQRNRAKINMRQLEKKLCDLHDSNIEHESYLMFSYRNLGKEKDQLQQEKEILNEKYENLIKIQNALEQRRRQLCYELKEIYPIEKKAKDRYTITSVYLPNAEKLVNDTKLLNTEYKWEPVSPLSLSVALGYVAHVIQMCSIILNLPLRNPIKHEGSRSRILDLIKDIPNTSREFPLYSRSSPPSKQFLYAVFLLNQNIAQLNFQVHGIKCDLRATLPNLLQLLDGRINDSGGDGIGINLSGGDNSQRQLQYQHQQGNLIKIFSNENSSSSLNEFDHKTGVTILGELGIASMSGSSVDLNNVPLPKEALISNSSSTRPIDVVDMKQCDQRISRSVGSYSDEQFSISSSPTSPTNAGGKQFHSSEPILTIHQIHITNFNESGNV